MQIGEQKTDNYLTRREFFSALITSVIVAGCPLPIGFPESSQEPLPPGTYEAIIVDIEVEPKVMYAKLLINGQEHIWRIPS